MMKAEMLYIKRGIGKAKAEAYVGEELAASGELMFAIINK
jgi:3-hydroxyacyl-[acyl-carrier-protein] dehydratase